MVYFNNFFLENLESFQTSIFLKCDNTYFTLQTLKHSFCAQVWKAFLENEVKIDHLKWNLILKTLSLLTFYKKNCKVFWYFFLGLVVQQTVLNEDKRYHVIMQGNSKLVIPKFHGWFIVFKNFFHFLDVLCLLTFLS